LLSREQPSASPHQGLLTLGGIAFAPDGIGRVYRVDSPGATPEEEAAIDHRLAVARPLVFEALQQLVNPQ
jgi:hypothetical protein